MERQAQNTYWLIDPVHSRIRFEARYLLISSLSGWFTQFEGRITTGTESFEGSRISLTIYTHSISTGHAERDNHLRSADFFDTRHYPVITFTSTQVIITGERLWVSGNLSIKNISQNIEFSALHTGTCLDDRGNTKAGLEMQLQLDRKAFGLTWNNFFNQDQFLLSDEVKIVCDIQLLKV